MYTVFTRSWWKENRDWPNGLEPCASGRKRVLRRGLTEEEAVAFCREYNDAFAKICMRSLNNDS